MAVSTDHFGKGPTDSCNAKEHNGGNPLGCQHEVRKAVNAPAANAGFYLTAASRDYGLTRLEPMTRRKSHLRNSARSTVYAPDPGAELALKKQAFLGIEIFKKLLDYYKGSNLPEMKYLGNTLTTEFELARKHTSWRTG